MNLDTYSEFELIQSLCKNKLFPKNIIFITTFGLYNSAFAKHSINVFEKLQKKNERIKVCYVSMMHMYERVKNKRNVFDDFFLYEIYPIFTRDNSL